MPPSPADFLAGLQSSLTRRGVDYEALIVGFGQVAASERRSRGDSFTLRDHIRGLILSQLSNQRPWKPIADNLERLTALFHDFQPKLLLAEDPAVLVRRVKDIRCGNRSIQRQMEGLASNIRTLERIAADFGSLDSFVVHALPEKVTRILSSAGPYKLRSIGPALAFEYLRNVGVRASKPDLHVRRAISAARLGYAAGHPSEWVAYEEIGRIAAEAGCNPTYFDNLLWIFCAQDYGDVCGAKPRCRVCSLAPQCRFPSGS